MRIHYVAHDTERPTGGLRMIYAHVAALRRHGFDAVVVHGQTGFRPDWIAVDVPIVYADQRPAVGADDAVVVPETLGESLAWAERRGARGIVFCQNHFYATLALDVERDWRALGCETVMCSSRPIAAFVRDVLGWPAPPVVPCVVDVDAFRPAPKILSIACMPQKRPAEFAMIRALLRRRFPRHDDVAFRPLRKATAAEVAATVGAAPVFLSLARHEGLGLAALEAMAADAVVVGFHGDGGRDYADARNGCWVEEGEIERCVALLAETLDRLKAGDPAIAAMRSAGRETVARYSQAAMEDALLAFWRQPRPARPRT